MPFYCFDILSFFCCIEVFKHIHSKNNKRFICFFFVSLYLNVIVNDI